MRNRRVTIRSAVFVLAMLMSPTLAFTQTDLRDIPPGPRRVDISGTGGFRLSTDWSDLVLLGSLSPASGALEQVLVRDLVVRPGPAFDAAVTYWEGRYGFRTHVGYAKSCLTVGRVCGELTGPAGPASSVDVNAWVYDVGGAVGLIDYRRNTWVWPYVFFGFGAVTYDLARTVGPPLTFIERNPPGVTDGRVVISRDDPDLLLIATDELGIETKFAMNVGVATDLRIPLGPAGVGIRMEVSDYIHRSPIDVLVAPINPLIGGRRDERLNFGLVHNLRAAVGLVVHVGR
jgi:hypothetical protein